MTNDGSFLFGMLLNHLIVFALFFHWLTFVFSTNELLILSRIDLLILQISDLEELINRNVGKLGNPSPEFDLQTVSFLFIELLINADNSSNIYKMGKDISKKMSLKHIRGQTKLKSTKSTLRERRLHKIKN